MRVAAGFKLATLLAVGVSGAALAQQGTQQTIPDGDWRTINRDLAATRYSPLTEINRGNVAQLGEAWNYPLRGSNTAVPLVIDSTMYVPVGNRVVALDADTGQEKWVYTIPNAPPAPGAAANAAPQPRNASGRGVGYWAGDASTPARILVMAGTSMLALDAATGQPVPSFGTGGMIDVGVSYGGTPTIAGDIAVIGAATLENPIGVPGNPRAFDVRTGRKLWEFQTVPQAGQRFNETWGNGWKGRSGTNMWAFSAPVDERTGTVILPIAGPSHNYFGGDRPGTNLFGNSLVAVDLKTGEYKWHYQTVHHDLWDIDMPSAGPLIDVTVNGERQPAIAHVGKSALFYVLDRETGEPLLPVEERAVPVGDVPGEYYHPTQPIPVNTPPLSRVSMTFDDIVTAEDTTPEHAAACLAMWDKAGGYINYGIFTPFMYKQAGAPPRSTIQFPGGTGGVNWGGAAADPTTGMVYVNAQDTSLVGWVERVEGDRPYSFDATSSPAYDRASVDGKGPFFSFSAPISGRYDEAGRGVGASAPCYKPPWGELVAVNANTGQIAWATPLGVIDDLPAGKQRVGNSGSAGPTVTAGGLVFVGATNDRRFRAFDAATGQQLWETWLTANANANPMSYRGRSGKQYVAINAGGVIRAYSLSR
jgi:quinoprotein glucose dehydrogenase